jgi:hypothetical protein
MKKPAKYISSKALLELTKKWRQIAYRAGMDARSEANPMGKKIIEMKMSCYADCLFTLESLLASTAHASASPSEAPQTTTAQALAHAPLPSAID